MAREEAQCEIVVEAIELGAAGYLEKTSAPETLLTKIQETLGDRQVPLKTLPKVGGGEVPLNDRVRAFERSLIEQALKNASGSVKQAMKTLGLLRRTLNEKMQQTKRCSAWASSGTSPTNRPQT